MKIWRHPDQIHDVKAHTRGCEERIEIGDSHSLRGDTLVRPLGLQAVVAGA
jgi:hypothetical protein